MLIIMQLDILKSKDLQRNIQWITQDGKVLSKIMMGILQFVNINLSIKN